MKVWLIYDELRHKRNSYYADLYKMHFKKRNIDCHLIFVERLSLSAGEWRYDGTTVTLPDCAIMRTYLLGLSLKLEDYGVRVFNNSKVAEVGNNKYLTYNFALNNGISVMETYLSSYNNDAPLSFPYIMKSLDGHGGDEVFLIKSKDDHQINSKKLQNKPHIVQKIASELGKDLRVYVLGNNIVTGMLRTSDTGFKSNYSLGGRAESVKISQDIYEIVNIITKNFYCDFVGIDFVFDNGVAKLNEIEDIVGSRMLYSIGLDIVSNYVDYIIYQMKTNKNSHLTKVSKKGDLWEDFQKTVQ